MKRAEQPPIFRRLQFRLAFSYMAVSVAAFVAVELALIAVLAYVVFSPGFMPQRIAKDAAERAAKAGLQMESSSATLGFYLEREFGVGAGENGNMSVGIYMYGKDRSEAAVVGLDGKIIAGYPGDKWKIGKDARRSLNKAEAEKLQEALKGREIAAEDIISHGTIVAGAAPIRDSKGRLLGVLFVRGDRLVNPLKFAHGMLNFVAATSGAAAVFAGVVGVLFGYISSRGLIRRLNTVGGVAEAWSKGEFEAAIRDQRKDEIGELARKLNSMAESLRKLMRVRQKLAAAEERNRIMGELHDTVKQQVFAASMSLAAFRARRGVECGGEGEELADIEKLLIKTQKDLADIIREIAPSGPELGDLGEALRELAAEWELRSGMTTRLEIDEGFKPEPMAARAVYHAVSEALANSSRHGRATRADIRLSVRGAGYFEFEARDDGRGCATTEGAGRGLGIMRERIESLGGGRVETESEPGGGFVIRGSFYSSEKQGGE